MSDDTRPSWEKAGELMRIEVELKKLTLDAYNSPDEAEYRANTYALQRERLADNSAEWREEYREIVRRQTVALERIAAALEAKR